MDVMQLRHRLLAMQTNVLDTSPVILEYGKMYRPNDVIDNNPDRCITVKYDCAIGTGSRRFTHYGLESSTLNYKNGEYYDYYNNPSSDGEKTNTILATGRTDQMAFTIKTSMLDVCYVIYEGTGEILFAGKNSIYYGHKNVSELE